MLATRPFLPHPFCSADSAVLRGAAAARGDGWMEGAVEQKEKEKKKESCLMSVAINF